MDLVNNFSLNITLEIGEIDFGKFGFERLKEFFERSAPINLWFSFTQEIEVGTVDDDDFQGKIGLVVI